MKRVLVTGANGFIGSALIKKLIENEINVIAIDRHFYDNVLPQHKLLYRIEADIDDVDTLQTLIPKQNYDVMYHFAWQGVNGPDKANPAIQLNNIQRTINCAMIAKEIGVNKLLCAGTIAEQAVKSLSALNKTSSGMLYGVAKHCAHLLLEAYCKNIGQDFVWMQFSNIYGPDNKTGNLVSYTIDELKKGNGATFGPALQPYDFVYIDDLLEAVYRLGETITTSNFYFIGSGSPRILRDYLIEIGELFGRRELIKIGTRADDGILYTFDMFEISKLRNDIGNYVSKTFTDGIMYTLQHY